MSTLPASAAARAMPEEEDAPPPVTLDALDLRSRIDSILHRYPTVGLALGVVHHGRLESFHAHGWADLSAKASVTKDTVFRTGSISKVVTSIAVMQLWEQGLLDLDAPANDPLRAYELVPAAPHFRPATLRHLLTHTAGIPEVVRASDLLQSAWGPLGSCPAVLSVRQGDPLPSLAEYYRGGLSIVAEPGTAYAYTNHGFATLGQIVEDVSGLPLERYFRERIFEPLGMVDSDLVRSPRFASRLAKGYVIGRNGPKAAPDRDWISAGASGVYSTIRDMSRLVAALLQGGANERGRVLQPTTLATMFDAHYQVDPRLPSMGLGFFRSDLGGHRVVGHEGILPGFYSALLAAPADDLGLVCLTTGSTGARAWVPTELPKMLRHLLGAPDEAVRRDIPQRPEVWAELCGRYQLPSRVSDLRGRAAMGAGAHVFVRGGRLMVRMLTPIVPLARAFPLHPADEARPYVFRLDLSTLGMPTVHIVFDREEDGTKVLHTDLGSEPLSLYQRPGARSRRQPRGA